MRCTSMPLIFAPGCFALTRARICFAASCNAAASPMLRITPPASVLCRMSGDKILATTGNSTPAACSGLAITAVAAWAMPSAAKTLHASNSLICLPGIVFSSAPAAAIFCASAPGSLTGGVQSRHARIASAHDSGVRKPATPALVSRPNDVSACGARKAARGLPRRSASAIGSIAICGCSAAELPTTASTSSA